MSLTTPDLLDVTDLDFEIECETRDCHTEASWWLICRACNDHTPLCRIHQLGFLLVCNTHSPTCTKCEVRCPRCKATEVPHRWRELLDIVPIER